MKSFKQHIGEKDMTAISSWKKKLKKVKGLTKQQLQILSTLPTPVLTSLITQVGMIVSGNDVEESTKAYGDSLRKIARDRPQIQRGALQLWPRAAVFVVLSWK